MFGRKPPASGADEAQVAEVVEQPTQEQKPPFWKAILPVMACGAGLFSDGYINNVRLSTPPVVRHGSFGCYTVVY
jgi:hypothetical protein